MPVNILSILQLRERIIPNSEMADVNWNFNSAVEGSLLELEQLGMSRVLRNEKVKAISTLVIRTRFARSTKTYTTFTSCQNAACSNTFFFCWQVDYALEGSPFWLSKCDFSHLFHTERSWHTYWFSVVFLNFWSARFALWCKSIFFDLFWSVKLFIVAK